MLHGIPKDSCPDMNLDRDRDDDDDYKGKKNKAKSNNGKHLGWEKGVGNPHKNGGKPGKGKGKN